MNPQFEDAPKAWSSKRKVATVGVLTGIMVVAVVVASSANKNEPAAVLQRQAFQDIHPMYQEVQQDVAEDVSLSVDDYPKIWGKVKADATRDGFRELVMCGNTYGAHYFWNEWNGGANTLRVAANHNRLVIRMYDQHGRKVQSNGVLTNNNAWWNVRHNVWINNSGLNGNPNGAKAWLNGNFGGDGYLKDRMWWTCNTNRHQNLAAGRVYWACGHGTHGGGGLHVDKVAKVCVWKWQNRNKPDMLDQFFLFYKQMTCRL